MCKKIKVFKEENYSDERVPNVVNMPLHEAIYLLENRGLKVQVQGYGHVVYQSLLANAKVVKGATILLQLQP